MISDNIYIYIYIHIYIYIDNYIEYIEYIYTHIYLYWMWKMDENGWEWVKPVQTPQTWAALWIMDSSPLRGCAVVLTPRMPVMGSRWICSDPQLVCEGEGYEDGWSTFFMNTIWKDMEGTCPENQVLGPVASQHFRNLMKLASHHQIVEVEPGGHPLYPPERHPTLWGAA